MARKQNKVQLSNLERPQSTLKYPNSLVDWEGILLNFDEAPFVYWIHGWVRVERAAQMQIFP